MKKAVEFILVAAAAAACVAVPVDVSRQAYEIFCAKHNPTYEAWSNNMTRAAQKKQTDAEYWNSRIVQASYGISAEKLAALSNAVQRATIESREIKDGIIVEKWRKGSAAWTTTNRLSAVAGAKMKSRFLERVEELETARDGWHAAFTNESLRAERAEARFVNATNKLQTAINEAKLSTTRLLLQQIMDKLIDMK